MRIIYFENDCVTITYDTNQRVGIAEWRGFISGNEFRQLYEKCLEAIQAYKLNNWVSDNRKMKAIRQQDQQWLVDEFIPKLAQHNLQRLANVTSEDIFNKMAIEQVIERVMPLPGLQVKHFETETQAFAWFEDKPQLSAQTLTQSNSME